MIAKVNKAHVLVFNMDIDEGEEAFGARIQQELNSFLDNHGLIFDIKVTSNRYSVIYTLLELA